MRRDWIQPEYGDERVVTRFLFFPVTLPLESGRYTVSSGRSQRWLERASWLEYYDDKDNWLKVEWIDG